MLPNSDDLKNMGFVYEGQPFIRIVPKRQVDVESLDYVYEAQPFLTNPGTENVDVTFDEPIPVLDQLTTYFPGGQDTLPIVDFLTTNAADRVSFNEPCYILDELFTSATSRVDIEITGSVELRVLSAYETNGSVELKVKQAVDLTGTVALNVLADNLVGVTNATAADNPTQTTLILGGQTIYSHPATLPPNGLSNARCYINYLCNSLFSDQSLSNFLKWNISIDGGQGTWRTTSITDFGVMGDLVEPFGLLGTITQKGREKTGGSYGYINGGILGKPLLNKPVAFLYAGVQQFTTINPNQALILPDPANWQTHSSAIKAIANVAGVSVNWTITDYPLTDTTFQAGQTGIEAMTSLAESVGAKLRPNGGDQYTVVYPNKALGKYTVPDCCLIQSMSNICYLDVKTGIYNPGVYAMPQYGQFNAGAANIPSGGPENNRGANGSFERNVEVLYITSKLETQQDPQFLLDLPFDFEDIFIKVITVNDGTGQFVTLNPSKWFLLQTGFGGEYVNFNDVAGVLQPQIRISWELFPQANTDVQNGKFKFIIGYTTKSLSGPGAESDSQQDQIDKQTQGRTWLRFRFIPVCQYNLTIIFSGAIPLPGMAIEAQLGDYIIGQDGDVIIENVDFSNPGILNITAIQWAEISYYDYFLGQG